MFISAASGLPGEYDHPRAPIDYYNTANGMGLEALALANTRAFQVRLATLGVPATASTSPPTARTRGRTGVRSCSRRAARSWTHWAPGDLTPPSDECRASPAGRHSCALGCMCPDRERLRKPRIPLFPAITTEVARKVTRRTPLRGCCRDTDRYRRSRTARPDRRRREDQQREEEIMRFGVRREQADGPGVPPPLIALAGRTAAGRDHGRAGGATASAPATPPHRAPSGGYDELWVPPDGPDQGAGAWAARRQRRALPARRSARA